MATTAAGESQNVNPMGPIEIFLLRSLPKKKVDFRPENARIKQIKYKSVKTLGPGIDSVFELLKPIYEVLKPVFGFKHHPDSGNYSVKVDHQPLVVSVSDLKLFDGELKGLRLWLHFGGKSFDVKGPTQRPTPKLFTLDNQGGWRRVALKLDPILWKPFWTQHKLEDWILTANGCQFTGVELTKTNFKVVQDHQTLCDIPQYQELIDPKPKMRSHCFWLEDFGELLTFKKTEQRNIMFHQYMCIQGMQHQFHHCMWGAWQIEYMIQEKIGIMKMESREPEAQNERDLANRSLERIFKGMAFAYHATGESCRKGQMQTFNQKCLKLSERVSELQGKSPKDEVFKNVEDDIEHLLKNLKEHFEYWTDFPKQLQQIEHKLDQLDANWKTYHPLCKILSCNQMNNLVAFFLSTLDLSPPVPQVIEPESHRVGDYLVSVSDQRLKFGCVGQSVPLPLEVLLPKHIAHGPASDIQVTAFRDRQLLVRNKHSLRLSFCLVDLGLAAKALSAAVSGGEQPAKPIYYKRPLPAVARNKVRYTNPEAAECPRIYLSGVGVTVLHLLHLMRPDLQALIHCVRKMTLSYIRPTLDGRQRNWLQVDLKGLTKHRWGYTHYALLPAILTDESRGRIFVATAETLIGTELVAYGKPKLPVVELEVYRVDWTGRVLRQDVEHKVSLDRQDDYTRVHEWRLVRGVVFYLFFNCELNQVSLHCFHKGGFVPAGKSTAGLAPGVHQLSPTKVTEVMCVVDGTRQPYALGRRAAETVGGSRLHWFFRLRPTY